MKSKYENCFTSIAEMLTNATIFSFLVIATFIVVLVVRAGVISADCASQSGKDISRNAGNPVRNNDLFFGTFR